VKTAHAADLADEAVDEVDVADLAGATEADSAVTEEGERVLEAETVADSGDGVDLGIGEGAVEVDEDGELPVAGAPLVVVEAEEVVVAVVVDPEEAPTLFSNLIGIQASSSRKARNISSLHATWSPEMQSMGRSALLFKDPMAKRLNIACGIPSEVNWPLGY